MSLLRFPERRSWLFDVGADVRDRRGATHSGVPVTPEAAERHSSVWACRAAIAETTIMLPVEQVVKRDGTVIRRDAPDVFYEPAPGMTWETWLWQQTWALAGHGRCYAMVTHRDRLGFPEVMVPVDDAAVRWRYVKTDNRWETRVDNEVVERWPLGPLWHVGLYVRPQTPQGMSPVAYHAESIGVGLAAQEFGARWFGDGGHPTAIVKTKKDPGDKGAAALKQRFIEVLSGGSREPIVVPADTEFEKWQVTADESQFLATMRYSGEDVARIFGVPPGRIALAISGQNVTYTNTSEFNNDWRMSGLARYTATLEAAFSRLVPGGRSTSIRFDFNEFLRPDAQKRATIYKLFADIGAITGTPVMVTNEMRSIEGLSPLPGGDTFVRNGQPSVGVNDDGTLVVTSGAVGADQDARGYDARKVAEVLQKLYLAVGKVITVDEARLITQTLGVELPPGVDVTGIA